MGFQDGRLHRERHPDYRRRPAFFRWQRRELLRAGRPQRFVAVDGESGRNGGERPHQLRGQQSPVRGRLRGQRAVCFRIAGIASEVRYMTLRALLPLVLIAGSLPAQVTSERILNANREPQNWLTYGGGYASQRYSPLTQLTRDNARDLKLKWVYRPKYLDKMEATPLVVDGVLYTVQDSEVVAMDAATGRAFWTFHYMVPPESNQYLMVVKGLAIGGDTLFWATYDGHLIAIDSKTGVAV